MMLSKEHPRKIHYRSPAPLLTPMLPHERAGVVENVVFPAGVDCRNDIDRPDRFNIDHGMNDRRIGVANVAVPKRLSTTPLLKVDAPHDTVPVAFQPAEATK